MRCPNCGHEMIKVFNEWVCPECEYHTGQDPLKGSFR